jgi:23S rRNA pseudouridine1911/1915/1917 synthase
MAIRLPEDGGKEAVTFYEVLERFRGYALVRCKPATGRTHQIRVHLAHIGHPIIADKAYSGRDRLTLGDLLGPDAPDAATVLIDRQALHAHSLRLDHPLTGQPLHLTAPLPDDMARTLEALRRHRPS